MTKQNKIILIIVIALVLLIGLGIGGYYYYKSKKKKTNTTPVTTTTTTSNKTNQVTDTSDTSTSSELAQNGTGWKIFKNFAEGYLIEYPDGATVENATDSTAPTNGAKCVKISNKYVWVVISSRNNENEIDCLRTGFGEEWNNAPDEVVTAAGATYTAPGMKTEAASAGYYQDDYMFTTMSGEKIEYGIDVNEKYDTTMTKAQAKELVHKMVASFSPAE